MDSPIKHLGIIMDGNGRWAQKRGLPRQAGHEAGVAVAKKIALECSKLNIPVLTLYTFSKENWKRPEFEISFLFKQLQDFFTTDMDELLNNSIQIRILGEIISLPIATRIALEKAVEKTKHCEGMILNLALNYSGRDEILRACKQLILDKTDPKDIDSNLFSNKLYTAGLPDPDLIIRTSGEQRTSNFLLYQSAYAEYYFSEIPWPDFSIEDLKKILTEFNARERRFGDTK